MDTHDIRVRCIAVNVDTHRVENARAWMLAPTNVEHELDEAPRGQMQRHRFPPVSER